MTAGLAILALLLASGVLAVMLRQPAQLPQAVPNARSLHVVPIPRVGGLAIWAGSLPAMVWVAMAAPIAALAWLPPWIALVLVSLRDDFREVAIVPRLAIHAACAIWCAWWLVQGAALPAVSAAWLFAALALLLAWSLNLYNFMDGSDGLAALMTITGFTAYGLVGDGPDGTLGYAIAAATLAFFVVNRPPARIFMGDAGSVPMGFLAAALGVAGVVHGDWGPWFPVLVFLPFIADATLTLLRRIWRRERWWEGHRSHYYQRLHQLGRGHAGTLAAYAVFMVGTAATAVVCARLAPEWGWTALLAWSTVLLLAFGAIDYHWRRRTTASP